MSDQPNNYFYVPYQRGSTYAVNIRAIVFRYIHNWYWFLLSIVLMGIVAYVYLGYQSPIYRSQASLLIKNKEKEIDPKNALKELAVITPKKVVEREIEILTSYTLMNQVVKQLNLDVVYFHETPYGKREIFEESPIRLLVERATPALYEDLLIIGFRDAKTVIINDKYYPINTSIQTPYGRLRVFSRKPVSDKTESISVQVVGQSQTVAELANVLKAEPTRNASTVILLTIETAVPDKGEAILNGLINAYNETAMVDKNQIAANTLKFIDERLELISGELATVKKGVELYKSAQGTPDLTTKAQSFLQMVQQNDAQLDQVNLQLDALNDAEQYVQKQLDNRGEAPPTIGLSDPTLLGLVENVTKLESQRDQLAGITAEQNPTLQSIDNQIKSTRASIAEHIARMKAMLTTAKQEYVAINNKMERVVSMIPAKERKLLDITRQQTIKNDLYTYLLMKREEIAVSSASTISDSHTIDAAHSVEKPLKPNKENIYLLLALIGVLVPAAIMAVRSILNNRIMRRADVEENTGVPILGEVMKNRQSQALIVEAPNQSVIAEQIRDLRTNLQSLRDSSQVLLFTSSVSGEGKSFVSLNLGASLGLLERRTVILEMDLRKPRLRHSLSDFPMGVGISNYLTGESNTDEVIQPIPNNEHYFIVTSGPIPPNPSELLSGPRLKKLISELRERFDYIVIDAPPIGLITDAQLIAPFADATIFVVRYDYTPKNYMRMVESLYQNKRFNKLNIVINAVDDNVKQYYNYGYKNKGYKYKYSAKKIDKYVFDTVCYTDSTIG